MFIIRVRLRRRFLGRVPCDIWLPGSGPPEPWRAVSYGGVAKRGFPVRAAACRQAFVASATASSVCSWQDARNGWHLSSGHGRSGNRILEIRKERHHAVSKDNSDSLFV